MDNLTLKEVSLIPVEYKDIETIRQWRNSKEVASYMYNENQITTEQQEAWFLKISKDSTCKYWTIFYNDIPMGLANLVFINQKDKRCDWAFYLGSPDSRGKGIGGKVEFLILDHVFNDMNLNKLCCEVFTSNEGVIAQHQKFGFKIEGTRNQHIQKNGEFLDIVEMALLKEDWLKYRHEFVTKFNG